MSQTINTKALYYWLLVKGFNGDFFHQTRTVIQKALPFHDVIMEYSILWWPEWVTTQNSMVYYYVVTVWSDRPFPKMGWDQWKCHSNYFTANVHPLLYCIKPLIQLNRQRNRIDNQMSDLWSNSRDIKSIIKSWFYLFMGQFCWCN